MIYELQFSIRHDEDWTVLTEEFDIKMRTVSYFTRRAGGRIVDVEVFNIGCSHQLSRDYRDLDLISAKGKGYENAYAVVDSLLSLIENG